MYKDILDVFYNCLIKEACLGSVDCYFTYNMRFDTIIREEKNFNLSKFNDHLAATMACKASVKGNTRITIEDMESLIDQLRKCDNPFNCPHGRPVVVEFTKYELEKMFKRSI